VYRKKYQIEKKDQFQKQKAQLFCNLEDQGCRIKVDTQCEQ
jgi:hypothetical protein